MAYDPNNRYAKILRNAIPAFRVYEDRYTLAFLEAKPLAPGHTIVVPKTRAETMFDIPSEWFGQLARTAQFVGVAVHSAFNPEGIKLLQPNGVSGEQSVRHVHFQIIPCYKPKPDAANIEPSTVDTARLREHAERLRKAVAALRAETLAAQQRQPNPPGSDSNER
jgi:histidine triad (HIT) family protein